jgi:hypothetical protein
VAEDHRGPAPDAVIRSLVRTTPARVLFAAYGITAAICAFVPLADHLGYEFATALTIASALFAPAVGVAAIRLAREQGEGRPARDTALAGMFSVAALLLPCAIILLNAVRRPICDPVAGAVWLLLLAAPTAWLSTMIGALSATILRGRWAAAALILAIELGSAIFTAVDAYVGPGAFGMDHFAGYYGGVARGAIPITLALVTFRVSTALWGVAIVSLVGAVGSIDMGARRMHRGWAIALTLLLVTISVAWGDELGWRASDRQLRKELAGELHVGAIVVHYARSTPDRTIELLSRDVQYTASEIERTIQVTPKEPLHLWIYPDAQTKARLVGNQLVNFAKPYRHEAHLIAEGFPQRSLRHELLHVYAGDFAPMPWRAAGGLIPNDALIEGFATAFDVDDGDLTLYQDAKAMRDLEIAPDLRALMSIRGFGDQSTSRAYNYSGAFIRYLADRFGVANVRELYRASDFSPLGPPAMLIADFGRMLDTVTSDAVQRSTAARRHSELAVTRRTCAREIYAITDSAYALAANHLWDASMAMFDKACALQPENPDLLRAKLSTLVRAKPQRMDSLLAVARRVIEHPRTDPTLEASTRQLIGDEFWRRGDTANARRWFTDATQIPSSPDIRRAIATRLAIFADPALMATTRDYLLGEGDIFPALLRMADQAKDPRTPAILLYLVGRAWYLRGAMDASVSLLSRAVQSRLPGEDMARESERLMVIAHSRRNACDAATLDLAQLRSLGGARADIATSEDWVRRCQFGVAHGWSPL